MQNVCSEWALYSTRVHTRYTFEHVLSLHLAFLLSWLEKIILVRTIQQQVKTRNRKMFVSVTQVSAFFYRLKKSKTKLKPWERDKKVKSHHIQGYCNLGNITETKSRWKMYTDEQQVQNLSQNRTRRINNGANKKIKKKNIQAPFPLQPSS